MKNLKTNFGTHKGSGDLLEDWNDVIGASGVEETWVEAVGLGQVAVPHAEVLSLARSDQSSNIHKCPAKKVP